MLDKIFIKRISLKSRRKIKIAHYFMMTSNTGSSDKEMLVDIKIFAATITGDIIMLLRNDQNYDHRAKES